MKKSPNSYYRPEHPRVKHVDENRRVISVIFGPKHNFYQVFENIDTVEGANRFIGEFSKYQSLGPDELGECVVKSISVSPAAAKFFISNCHLFKSLPGFHMMWFEAGKQWDYLEDTDWTEEISIM